jgi:twitching motility protein PilT
VISQREVGLDTPSFAQGLKAALREDINVVLVGEIRDLDSISSALTLAETGHLIFATLHTNDAAQSVDRIVDVFPGDQQPQIRAQLASVLSGVVSMRLLPKIGGGRVPAPLLSYGGSSLLAFCVMIGLLQSVYRHQRDSADSRISLEQNLLSR